MSITVNKVGTFTGHRDCLYTVEGYPEQPGTFFTSGGDGLVVQWNLGQPDQGKLVAQVQNTCYALCHVPEVNHLLVGENQAGLHKIDLAEGKEIGSVQLTDQPVFALEVYRGRVFVALGGGVVKMLDYGNLSTLGQLDYADMHARALALHPQRNELAVGYSDHHIRVFDLSDGQLKQAWKAHEQSVFCLNYSPDGRWLLSGGRDAHLKVWNPHAGYAEAQSIVAHMYTINHVSYRPDGRYFATCSKDKSVKVWDAAEFRLLKVIDKARHAGHGTSVNRLHWADGQTLVSVSDDRTVSVWEIGLPPD